ncbi:XRE family transcriptional regulator [Photobacterium jeanii]|uniref:XRE family transcriptional regulator n=1 Tax=Photobacterium jeanii TaxID=858640 RepID=A0A178K1J9_9GAMM|nr:AraC family transcriptional regulator [Photobacterium jeanii]OAN11198.1 XRE family transcriptional regulator [Photobacterium jeanii]PST90717.1 AraC family transcriptional regulator [Photobacterium jeanii]
MSLKSLMQRYVDQNNLHDYEGSVATKIEDVRFYRSKNGHSRQPMMYKSGIIVLGQGRKALYAGGKRICYGEGDCLIMGVPMPVECEAFPSNNEPLLGISIQIHMPLLQKLVAKIKHHRDVDFQPVHSEQSIRREPIDTKLNAACERLMLALCDDLEAAVIGQALLEEVIFFALMSKSGNTLFTLADQEGRYARIASVLQEIHTNYSSALNVSELASSANMSVSSFHTAFRNVTLESPIQYIKKVRLNKGRELICFQGKRVNEAADLVGYSSAAQFSREFKRQFNLAPKDAASTVG